jgi:hypothetical protein
MANARIDAALAIVALQAAGASTDYAEGRFLLEGNKVLIVS